MSKAFPYVIGATSPAKPKTPEEDEKELADIIAYLRQYDKPQTPQSNLDRQAADNDNPFYRPFGYPERSINEIEQRLENSMNNIAFNAKCGIGGFGQGTTAYNFDELGGVQAGVTAAVQSGFAGNNPLPEFKQGYVTGRDNQRAFMQECYSKAPIMTHGAELAGAIALEALSRGRLPAAYLAKPAINFACDLGMASVSAFGQSESQQDFGQNLNKNMQSSGAYAIGKSLLGWPDNIFTEELSKMVIDKAYDALLQNKKINLQK